MRNSYNFIVKQIKLLWCRVKKIEESGSTGGGIQSVQPGTNITVDNTDPANPTISVEGGGDFIPLSGTEEGKPVTGIITGNEEFNKQGDRKAFAQMSDVYDSTDNLKNVVNVGNYSAKPISFLHSGDGITGSMNGNIGVNATYSFFFGNMPLNQTGFFNASFGYNSLSALTSGNYNVSFGSSGLKGITTGNYNSSLGYNAGGAIASSVYNVFVGANAGAKFLNQQIAVSDLETISPALSNLAKNIYSSMSGYNSTDQTFEISMNTLIGGNSVNGSNSATRAIGSTIIGASTLHNIPFRLYNTISIGVGNYSTIANSTINNAIIIGNHINTNNIGNKLVIDNGINARVDASNALLYGDFSGRWLKVNGKFYLNSSHLTNAQGNSDFSKRMLFNPTTGELGYADEISGGTTINANKQRFMGDTISAKTLSHTPMTNSVSVILNGIELDEQGGDYTISGTTVNLLNEPLTTDIIIIKYLY